MQNGMLTTKNILSLFSIFLNYFSIILTEVETYFELSLNTRLGLKARNI